MATDSINNNKDFLKYIVNRLGTLDLDFVDQMALIREKQKEGKPWSASGVLVPIEFDPIENEYVIILNKRSRYVQQPGDLCCPGGGMDRKSDMIIGYLFAKYVIPPSWSGPLQRLSRLHGPEREIFARIWAGILRESWEEMRLNPCNVEFLGGLPAQQMQSFPKCIFPLVGRVRGPWRARLNWEVERIVRVRMREFLEMDNYAIYSQRIPSELKRKVGLDRWELPCFVIKEEGNEEILWGATLKIVLHFVQTVMDFPVERVNPQRKIERDLPVDYFTGRPRDSYCQKF